jgi:hypothetical protein
MSDKTESGMTMSSESEAVLLAVKARIAAIPAGRTLIDTIPNCDWLSEDVGDWMINVGSHIGGDADELDEVDKVLVA